MRAKDYISELRQSHWIFAIIALTFGLVLICLTPPLWGADEAAHFFKAYQVSRGDFSPNKVNINGKVFSGGYVPKSLEDLSVIKDNDIADNPYGNPSSQVDSTSTYKKVGNIELDNQKNVINPFGAIIYSPLTYTAPALGMAVSSLFIDPTALSLLYSARVATLMLYVAMVAFSIYILKNKSAKWIIFVVALLPMSLYQASVVSADSLVVGLSLIVFALSYNLIGRKEKVNKRYIVTLLIAILLLVFTKPPYVLLALPLVFLPLSSEMSKKTRIVIKLFIPIVCLIFAGLVVLSSISSSIAAPSTMLNVSLTRQLGWIIQHPIGYINTLIDSVINLGWIPQTIGIFGTSFIYMPGPIVDLLMVLLLFMAFIKTEPIDEGKESVKRVKLGGLAFLSAGILAGLAVITTLFLSWTQVGAHYVEGVQGRYFLPTLCFTLIGLRMVTKARYVVSEKSAKIYISLIVVFSLLCSMLWYYRILY